MNLNENQKSCIVCNKASFLYCQRCGDSYCSTICQYRDWPSHRYICFPIPPLVRNPQNTTAAPQDLVNSLHMLNMVSKPNGIIPNQDNRSYNNQQNRPSSQQQHHTPQQQQLPKHLTPPPQQQYHQSPVSQQQLPKRLTPPPQQHYHQSPVTSQHAQQPKQQAQFNVINEIPKAEYPRDSSYVILTGPLKTNIGYVRSKDPEVEHNYKQILKQINSYSTQLVTMKNPPRNNTYVMASFSNGDVARVQILGRVQSKFRVFFIDLGKESLRNQTELLHMPDEIAKLKQYVLPVMLNMVPQKVNVNGDPYENKTYQIEYIELGKVIMPTVNLINIETQQTLNQELSSGNQNSDKSPPTNKVCNEPAKSEKTSPDNQVTKTPSPPASVCSSAKSTKGNLNNRLQKALSMVRTQQTQPVLKPPFEFKKLVEGETQVKVVIMDVSVLESGVFGCVRESDMSHVQRILKYCSDEYKPGTEPFKPVLNEYCMAFFEDKWYRAQCVSIEGDIYSVFYIDFTNEEKVTKDKLRPYPMDCTLDCCTVTCAVAELENMNEMQLEFLTNWGLRSFSTILIEKVFSDTEGLYFIELNEMLEKMRQSKLL